MATKTVVCPDCGAAAAPGRYACPECSALLASVAVTPRSWPATEDGGSPDGATARAEVTAPPALMTQVDPDLEPNRVEPESEPEPAEAAALAEAAAARRPSSAVAFDEDAPLGSAGAVHDPVEPGVLPDLADDLDHQAVAAEEVAWPTHEATAPFFSPVDPRPRFAPEPEPAPSFDGAPVVPATSAAPAWPPAGGNGAIARPEPRTPAGAYLPPSAVLPPLDGGADPATAATAHVAGQTTAPTDDLGSALRTWASRASAALGDALEGIDVTADGTRRAVAIGAGIAALGVLLPWINGPANEGALAGYLDRWGLAGPGMWLVFLGIVALAVIAASSGRAAAWPVGLPAIGVACFLGGVLWPYVLGGFGRSIGVWVVLAGAIVLAVGGVLDRADRHPEAHPGVSTGDIGGR